MPVTFGQTLSLRKPSFPIRFVHDHHRGDCFIDEDTGIEHCRGLSSGARIGIIIGICVLFLVLITAFVIRRRRQNAQENEYIRQTRVVGGNIGGVPPSFPPQYPTQGYNESAYAFDPITGFAPPAASQRNYPPPPGPPPMSSGEYKGV